MRAKSFHFDCCGNCLGKIRRGIFSACGAVQDLLDEDNA